MKTKDLGIIAVVVIVSAFISYFASSILISSPDDRKQSVETVEAISPEFTRPDSTYFNEQSVNPTQSITVGPAENPNPFGSQ